MSENQRITGPEITILSFTPCSTESSQRRNHSIINITAEFCCRTRSIYDFSDACVVADVARKPEDCKMKKITIRHQKQKNEQHLLIDLIFKSVCVSKAPLFSFRFVSPVIKWSVLFSDPSVIQQVRQVRFI